MRLLFLLSCLMVSVSSLRALDAKPNFVVILIDDMGVRDGECFGSKFYETPALNRLASESMKFTNAYAACAVCSPTRAALLTGKSPARLHLTDWIPGEGGFKDGALKLPNWTKQLSLKEVTLAEVLKGKGYRTAHIGKWHLGPEAVFPQHQGFDVNVAGGHIGHPASYFWPYGKEGASHRVPGLQEGGKEGEYLTDRLTEEALRFITENRDKPFYLNLAHYAVHSPLEAKPEEIELAEKRTPADGQGNTVYAGMLRSVDASVAKVEAKLEELGLAKNTFIVFTSDNGGVVHFGKPPVTSNAPYRLGKGYAYEGGLRVPLLIKAPGLVSPGSVCETPVISMDLFPTVLDMSGDKPAADLDGVSLLPVLKGGDLSRDMLCWHYPHYWASGKVRPYSVIRKGDWKLIRFYETGKEELYDLKNDVSEAHDLAQKNPEKRQELAKSLDGWLHKVGAQIPERK